MLAGDDVSKPATQAERIAALEAERPFNQQAMGALMDRFDKFETHMDARLDKFEERLGATERKMAEYENKGKGFAIGLGLFFTGAGAAAMAAVSQFLGWFK